jgi:outer membrane protein assembly factor BamA
MRPSSLFRLCASLTFVIGAATTALGQAPEPEDRQTIIENAATEKAKILAPYKVTTAEKVITRIERHFTDQNIRWHPFLENAYQGGGFAAGAGYMFHPSSYSSLDVRGSYSIRSYKLAEAEFVAPRLFDRRGELTVLGGWRDATQVSFYGLGMNTSTGDRTDYGFEQPFGSALLTVRPTRRLFMLRGGFEASRWDLKSGTGTSPSVDEVFTPASLPGLGATTTDFHTQATAGFDSRLSSGYARRGGYYGVTGHDHTDRDDAFGFRQVDYEVIQHIPILRETWVVSLHGLAKTSWDKGGQATPFYMLPSLGGGSNLRGFSSNRFADHHSLLLQAEWRIMANRFFESAVFYDAGKVTERTSDLDLKHLKSDYGFGVRFHAPLVTVLRVDVARSNEGTRLVFAAGPSF